MATETKRKLHWADFRADFEFSHLYWLIFLTPFIVNPFGAMPFSISKHAWMVSVIGLFLAIIAVSLFYKKTNSSTLIFNKFVFVVIALWLISFSISTIFSISPLESFRGSYERMQGLISIIYYAIHFLICLQLFQTQTRQTGLFKFIMATGAVLSLHAILQKIGLDTLSIGNIDEVSGRSYATIGQPNLLGQYLLFPIIASAIFAYNSTVKKSKLIYRLIFLLTFAGLLTTYNRASLLALGITSALLILYKTKLSKAQIAAASLLLLSISGLAIVFFGAQSRSFQSREILWQTSAPLIQEKPLFGHGPETYYQTAQTVITKDLYKFETLYKIPDRLHNETIQIIHDQGIFGVTIYLCTLFFLIWCFLNRRAVTQQSQIALFFLIATAITNQFGFPETIHYLIILMAWAVLLTETLKFETLKLKISLPAKIFFAIVLLLFSAISFYRSVTIVIADIEFEKGISAYFQSYEKAGEHFKKANSLNPNYRYIPYNTIHFLSADEYLGSSPENQKALEQYLGRTCELNNYSYHCNMAEAKYLNALGKYSEVQSSYQSASKKAPNFPTIYQEWGDSAYERGDYKTAITQFEILKDLAPQFWKAEMQKTNPEEHRIFKKTHPLFFLSMQKLADSYERTGQFDKSNELNYNLL